MTIPGDTVRLGGRSLPLFQVLGVAGLAVAVALTQALAAVTGRSGVTTAALSALAVLTFLGLAMSTTIVTGNERLVALHHEIAVLGVATTALVVLGAPVLPYLDLVAVGLGAFLVLGRVGCLFAGCCHGLPHRFGVRYGGAHGASGLDPHLLGARLFPTPLVESLAVLALVAAGSWAVLARAPAGTALCDYLVGYSVLRFGLELTRGDLRPYLVGLSQSQWLALGVAALVATLGVAGLVPRSPWHLAAAALGLWAATVVARHLRAAPRAPGWSGAAPRAHELAAALDDLAETPTGPDVRVASTAGGLRISRGRLPAGLHYTVSADDVLGATAARRVARTIVHLRHPDSPWTVLRGGVGTIHVLVGLGVDRPTRRGDPVGPAVPRPFAP